MTDSHVRLLVVDDEESLRIPLKRYLERNFGYQVDAVDSSTAALEQAEARAGQYDVALIDEVLVEGLDGIETMQELQTLYPDLEAIIFTGWGARSKQRALRAGAFRYLEKPVNYDELAMVIRTAAQQVRLQEIGRVILAERDLARVLEQITGAANSMALGDEAAIVLQEPHTRQLTVHARTHSDGTQWQRHFIDRWASREIIDSSRVVWVPDTECETGVHPEVIQVGVRSFLGVPIPGPDGNLGALYVYSDRPGRFEDWGTVSVLQTLAGHAGLALTNVQAFGQVRAQAIGMELLVQAARELTSATKLEDQLGITWDFVREQLQASTFFVSLHDESTDTVSFPLFYDEYELVLVPEKTLGDEADQWGTTGWVIKHGEELRWNSAEQREQQCKRRGITPSTVGKPCQSCFFLPLTRGEQVIGVVSIQSYDQYAFDSVLLNTFRALGSQLVAAMENTRLLEAEAKRRREAETLREAAQALTTTLEQHEIFERILSELQKVVPYDSASVQLLRGDRLEVIGGRGFSNPEEILGLSFPLDGDNPNREVVRRRDWFIVADGPSSYGGFLEEPCLDADIRGWLGVPMLVGDRIVGMITLDKHEPAFYTEEHAGLAQTFAAQAAVALENSRLFSELGAAMEWREALIEHAFDALIAIDEDKKITVFNRQAEQLFGRTAEEVLDSQRVGDLYFDIEKAREVDQVLTRAGSVSGWEVEIKYRDGTPVPVLLSATVLQDNNGRPIGQAGFMRDRRRVRLLESRLRALMIATQAVAGAWVLGEVLDRIVKAAVAAFPSARDGFIRLHDAQANTLRLKASTHASDHELYDALDLKVGEGIAGWVFQHRSPVNVADARQDARYRRQRHAQLPPLKSIIAAPLQAQGQVIGTLSLENRDVVGVFEDEDLGLLRSFADQAAVAIVNVELFQEAEESKEKLRSLYEASSALISAQQPEQVLKDIVERARLAAKASWVSVILVDEVGQARTLVRVGIDKEFDLGNLIRPNGLTMQVMRSGQAVIIENRDKERERPSPSMFRNNVAAALCLPLSLQGEQIGVMWLHYDQPRRFPAYEVDALQLYVNQASIAYDSACRMQELEHMRKAAEAMAGALEPPQVLQQIVESANEVLRTDSSAIWSYDDVGDKFIPEGSVAVGIPTELWERFRLEEPQRGRTAYNVMDLGYVSVTDVADFPRYDFFGDATRELLGTIGIQSFQGIALRDGRETLGVLYVNYNRPRGFGKEDKRVLETFANHAALALKKARLLEQVSKARDAAHVVAEVTVLEDLKGTLGSIVQGTCDALGCGAVTLYTYDQDRAEIGYPPAMIGVDYPEKVMRLDRVPVGSIVLEFLKRQEPYLAEDTGSDPLLKGRRFVKDEKIKSCVAIPLQVGVRKVGIMFVNYRSRHRFTADELANIKLFANQAAVAIRNAQLYQAEQRYAQALEAIQATSAAVSSVLDLDVLLPMITDQAAIIFSAPATSLMLWDEQEENLVIRAAVGLGDEYRRGQQIARANVCKLMEKQGLDPQVFDIEQRPIGIRELVKKERLYTTLVAPLTKGGELTGVLNIYSRDEPRRFDEKEVELARIFANHAAIAIQDTQLYDEINARAVTLQTLYEAGKAIASSLTLEETLDQIVKQARNLTKPYGQPTQFSHLALVEGKRIRFVAANAPEIREELNGSVGELDLEQSPRSGIVGRVVKTGNSQNVGDTGQDPDYVQLRSSTRSQLAVPVVIGDRVIGVINVEHPEYDAFDQEDQEALEHLAAQAAVAIQNARLYEQAQIVADISREAARRLELDAFLETLFGRLKLVFQDRQIPVYLCLDTYDKNTDTLIPHPTDFYPAERPDAIPLTGTSIVARVAETRSPYYAPDVSQDPYYHALLPDMRSEFAVPICSAGELLGILNLESPAIDAITVEDQQLLGTLADQIATSIDNVQHYEALKDIKGFVGSQTVLDWTRMVSTAWGHGIKREVGTSLVCAELVRQAVQKGQKREALAELEDLERTVQGIKDIPITAPLSAEDAVTSVRINRLVEGYLRNLWRHSRYGPIAGPIYDLQADLDSTATVRASEEWVRRGLEIVIDNAVQAMLDDDSPKKELHVATSLAGRLVEIEIRDTGPGIPPEIWHLLFHRPIDKPKNSRGAGVGLVLASNIFEAYHGSICLEDTGPSGTTIVISLPVESADSRVAQP